MMKIWDITLDADEGYWILKVSTDDCDGDECVFRFQLPADVAEQLHRHVRREIAPWLHEKETARNMVVSHPTVARVRDELEAGVYADDMGKRLWAERVVSGETAP